MMERSVIVFLCAIMCVPSTLCQFTAKENKGIPNVPPPGVEEHEGIPNVPPFGVEEDTGIPNVPPPGIEDDEAILINRLAPRTSQTTLPPLTPVSAETRLLSSADTSTRPPSGQIKPIARSKPTAGTSEHLNTIRSSPKAIPNEDYIDSFPEPPVCGVTHVSLTKVVGGVGAKLGDFPWMALLYYLGKEAGWKCGGSLVSSKHVLTAAHCIHNVEDRLYLVRLGELDLAREDDGASPVDILIKKKIKHEDYNNYTHVNDIGLLVLQDQVKFTSLIRPICIPVDAEFRARSYVDFHPIIAGWGRTAYRGAIATHLQTVQVPVIDNKKCANVFKDHPMAVIDERVLCAGYVSGGKDSCKGDSGGPLMQEFYNVREHTSHYYQTGLVSYGIGCAEPGFPGVYTRVTHFVPWLQEKMLGKV